jgi:hypothetical protein
MALSLYILPCGNLYMFTYTYTNRQTTEEKERENKQTKKETRKPFWLNNVIDDKEPFY